MSYTVLYDTKHNIAELRFHDTASIQDHIDSRNKAIELCVEKQTDRLLVHLGNILAQDTTTKNEHFDFAESWDKKKLTELYVAVVMPENVSSQDEFYFMIAMLKMNGVTIKSFHTEELAVKWLTEENKKT